MTKIRYATKNEAWKDKKKLEKKYRTKYTIYKCADCKGWHYSTINK